MTATTFVNVSALDCRLVAAPWSFALDRAAEIDAHWRKRLAQKPDMFNGRVLVLGSGDLAETGDRRKIFRGTFQEVEFKAFLAWREFGFPASGVRNCFSMAALESADGAFILGEMGQHTATAGQIYFPSGTPDLADVIDGCVDVEGSARRELREETGLKEGTVAFQPGLVLVMDPVRVCCMKPVRSPKPAAALVDDIHGWLARETQPELSRMHIIRHPDELGPAVPPFVAAYIHRAFAAR